VIKCGISEASLSFLGFGIPPSFPSWGGMLSGTGQLVYVCGAVDGYMARPCPEHSGLWCKHVWRCGERYTRPEVEGWCRALRGDREKRSQSKESCQEHGKRESPPVVQIRDQQKLVLSPLLTKVHNVTFWLIVRFEPMTSGLKRY